MIDRMTSRANLKRMVQCIMQFVLCHIAILLPYSILSSLLSLFYTLYCPLYFSTVSPLSATLYVLLFCQQLHRPAQTCSIFMIDQWDATQPAASL